MLTISSLISILLFSFHVADDIIRGIEPGTLTNSPAILIFVVWMYGTLVLAERRSGLIIVLLTSILSLAVPILHLRGRGVGIGSSIPNSRGGFFFVWTLFALGTTALFSGILCVHGLWRLRRRRQSEKAA